MKRVITKKGLQLVMQYEGLSREIYVCPAGYPTIGYGHVVRTEEVAQYADGVTKAQAEAILRADLRIAEAAVVRLITTPLTDAQFDALVSFTFNLGAGALQRSSLRQKVNRGEHNAVPAEFMRWVWAGGRRLEGLARRRKAEAERYLQTV